MKISNRQKIIALLMQLNRANFNLYRDKKISTKDADRAERLIGQIMNLI